MVLTGPLGNLCIACGVMFSSIEGRLKHEKASHSTIELTCNECPFVALGAKNLNNHRQKHQKSRCDFCWNSFPTASLAKHKVICQNNPEPIIVRCDECPFETKRKDHLKRHIQSHNKSAPKKKIKLNCMQVYVQKKAECQVCKKTFATKKCMMVHLNTIHKAKVIKSSQGFGVCEEDNIKPSKDKLICDKCNYKAGQISNLKRHMKTHDLPKKEKLTNCNKCDFKSSYPKNVTKHMLTAKHDKSKSTEYRKLNSLKEDMKYRKVNKHTTKVFGPEEVKKLVEDCEGSVNDILRVVK